MSKRIFAPNLIRMRRTGQKIVMVTAYDYPFGLIADRAGVDVVLVGDSLASVVQGLPNTLPVTLEQMIYHTQLVGRAVERALIVADMPFMSFQLGSVSALESAGRLVKEGGAMAVKLEGGERSADAIDRIVSAGIPVMAHIGLTPQSYNAFGGYRVQGREADAAERLVADALSVQRAGAFAVVLEGLPAPLGRSITEQLEIPTIGIGAGDGCSGQVLVLHDLLGLTPDTDETPKFVRRYASLGEAAEEALRRFAADVRAGSFPGGENFY